MGEQTDQRSDKAFFTRLALWVGVKLAAIAAITAAVIYVYF